MKGKRLSILVLGATGMLGHTLFYDLLQDERFDVRGTIRGSLGKLDLFWDKFENRLIYGIDATHPEDIWSLILRLEPDVVINAIGMIRQRDQGDDPLTCVELNSRLPLLLDTYCRTAGVRLIHISTDCVFAGGEEIYTEESLPTASDVYGLSKYLGELHKPPSLTLRTSIIGHELKGRLSLLESGGFFLANQF
jgi:dTDP-4-dehydrorhamnose reductase